MLDGCMNEPMLVLMSAVGVLTLIFRWFEFKSLTLHWDTNAYGSLLWVLLGLHTTHLLTDVAETIFMTVMCARSVTGLKCEWRS